MANDIECVLLGPCRQDQYDVGQLRFFVYRDLTSVFLTLCLWTYAFMLSIYVGFCHNHAISLLKEHRELMDGANLTRRRRKPTHHSAGNHAEQSEPLFASSSLQRTRSP